MVDPPPYPGTPRWVKALGLIAAGLTLLVLIVILTGIGGPHGPDRHLRAGERIDDPPPLRVTQVRSPQSR